VLLSALAGATLALLAPVLSPGAKASWVLFGFEVVVVVAAALGILFGRGRFGEAPGLALACVAGTILIASLLGWQASGRTLMGRSLTPLLAWRAVASLALAAAAALCVLSRDPRAVRRAGLGAVMVLPAVLVVAGALTRPGRRILSAAVGQNPVQQVLVCTMGGLVVGGLFAAGGHQLIRAFEMGRRGEAGEATSSRAA
jgi:hypothetical protein